MSNATSDKPNLFRKKISANQLLRLSSARPIGRAPRWLLHVHLQFSLTNTQPHDILILLGWQQSHFVFFMIFKASLFIQITNINQLCINYFVR